MPALGLMMGGTKPAAWLWWCGGSCGSRSANICSMLRSVVGVRVGVVRVGAPALLPPPPAPESRDMAAPHMASPSLMASPSCHDTVIGRFYMITSSFKVDERRIFSCTAPQVFNTRLNLQNITIDKMTDNTSSVMHNVRDLRPLIPTQAEYWIFLLSDPPEGINSNSAYLASVHM